MLIFHPGGEFEGQEKILPKILPAKSFQNLKFFCHRRRQEEVLKDFGRRILLEGFSCILILGSLPFFVERVGMVGDLIFVWYCWYGTNSFMRNLNLNDPNAIQKTGTQVP